MIKSLILGLGILSGSVLAKAEASCDELAVKFKSESLDPHKFRLVSQPELKIPGAGFVFQSITKDYIYLVIFTPLNLANEEANLYGKCEVQGQLTYMYVLKSQAKVQQADNSGQLPND